MATEHQNNPNQEVFLKQQEALLERAKNGDRQALAELRIGNKEAVIQPDQEISEGQSNTSEASGQQSPVISQELTPTDSGSSSAMKAETDEMTKEVLERTLNGLDINNPDAVMKALIEMGKKKAEQNLN
jgi:hypothetical protein